jgi:DNA ligase-1
MKTLYKRARNGKIQQWSVEIEGDKYRATEGYVDGKLTTSEWTVCQPKNVGRSNEVSAPEQAVKQAISRAKKKKDRGYVEDISFIDQVEIVDPMLAYKWKDRKDKTVGLLASQPKLDGIRCVGTINGLFTRQGKKITSAPHIESAVIKMLDGVPEGVTLDGELYNHDLKENFNEITSIVRKQKPKQADLEKSKQVLQYHVYDIDHQRQTFAQRFSALKILVHQQKEDSPIKLVDTVFIERNDAEDNEPLMTLYQGYLTAGFEGQMIRGANSLYKSGRSKDLLKRKEFEDGEFQIVDIEEGAGNRSGMMGRVKFDGFDSNARGGYDFYKELWENKDKYIGKMATVRYQNLTPDGKPRFPVMIAIRDYE